VTDPQPLVLGAHGQDFQVALTGKAFEKLHDTELLSALLPRKSVASRDQG
jgi:hypothetical protein